MNSEIKNQCPENEAKQPETILLKNFESIRRIVFSETKAAIMKYATECSRSGSEFSYNGMNLTDILNHINRIKEQNLVILDEKSRTSIDQITIQKFCEEYGLGTEKLKEIIDKFSH